MNIVIISSYQRPHLFEQTMDSLRNAANPKDHEITVVYDYSAAALRLDSFPRYPGVNSIILDPPRGASAARNIGAWSIPKHRRQKHVLFLDDDAYMVKGWDWRLSELADGNRRAICSGYSHPFNPCEFSHDEHGHWRGVPLVISSVAMMMPWFIFDEVGPWDEPGGPGGSEDYAFCVRARERGYGFAVSEPQCVIHTGMRSSDGKPIVGYTHLLAQNQQLLELHGLKGQVIFG